MSLVEKSDIFSKENYSRKLETLFNQLFEDCNNGPIIEILSLILSLSDNPFQRKWTFDQEQIEESVEKKSIDEIFNSPYTGQHWEMFNTYDDNDDNDDIVSEHFTKKNDIFSTEEIIKIPPYEFIPVNMQELNLIEMSQYWRTISCQNDVKRIIYKLNYGSDVSTVLNEINVVREIIFMMQGNETVLFLKNDHDIKINENFSMSQISHTMFMSSLGWFVERAQLIDRIRNFISKSFFESHLEDAFISSIKDLLGSLDSVLVHCQSLSANLEHNRIFTLLYFQNILDKILAPYMVLSDIISKIDLTNFEKNISDFLDMLFDKAKFYYSVGEQQTFLLITSIWSFLLTAYLKPLESWFSYGELPNLQGFFITKSTLKPNDLLWLSEYQLNLTADGTFLIPNVLKKICKKSLLIGKSKKLLISIFSESKAVFYDIDKSIFQKLNFDYHTRLKLFSSKMHDIFSSDSLSFENSGILNESYEYKYLSDIYNWVDENYYTSIKDVYNALFYNAEFEKHLNAVFEIYCMYNNSYIINFINSIFEKMDQQKIWLDEYILQDLIQISMKNSTINMDLINIKTQTNSENDNTSSYFYIYYKLPLSLTWIITSSSQSAYYKIFNFMFQLLKSRHDIKKYIFLFNNKLSIKKPSTLIYRNLSQIKLYFNWLINMLISYFFDIVIKTHVENLQKEIKKIIDLDNIIDIHNTFINSILTYCFLNLRFKPIYDSIMEILMHIGYISDLIISFQEKNLKTSLHSYLTLDKDMNSDFGINNRKVIDNQLKNEETLLKSLINIQKKTCSILKFIISKLQELPQELTSMYIEILIENLNYGVLDIEF
ncbi:hypothetical protein PCANB_002496 [Pneumocystis canis]|nr:hypothetical protein PCANB_002496 [Pneumocystis canis]